MKSMIRILSMSIIFVCSMTACVDSNTTKIERAMQNPLNIPTELSDSISVIKIIRYVRPKSCTSCELELGMWRIYDKNIRKKFGDKAAIKFIVETTNVKETVKLLSMYNLNNNSYIDSTGMFTKYNPHISHIGSDVVMVVDKQNNVILIGNPCKDVEIQHITDSVLNKYVFHNY